MPAASDPALAALTTPGRLGDVGFAYVVRRSRRRRRTFEVALDPQRGVVVAVPWRTSAREVDAFVRSRAPWVRARLAAAAPAGQLSSLATLPYLGHAIVLQVHGGAGARASAALRAGALCVQLPQAAPRADASALRAALVRWYRRRTAALLEQRVGPWATLLGCAPARVLVRDQRRRWGSCAPDGTLRFNLRLAMLDPELVDYVIVHELAHLLVPSHGPGFWTAVQRVLPDARVRARALATQALPPL
jgi:predicted metal-dependent hydrolase